MVHFSDEFLKALNYRLSAHALQRGQQRGFKGSDVELILAHGTDCTEATILTDKDAEAAIAQRKQEIQDLERLKGAAAIHAEGVVTTLYRPSRVRRRRLLGR
ncbi:MAG: hypothetical protein ACYC6F_02795 [Longimicrobiales bacterium]